MPSCEECQFTDQYTEAIEASGFPEISEIRELVVSALENPSIPPANPMYWPLHTFISTSLDRKVPLNWLTAPPLNEREIYNKATQFYDNLLENEKIYVCDENDDPVECSESLMSAIERQVVPNIMNSIKQGGTKFLEQTDHIHVQVEDGEVIESYPCPKVEMIEKLLKSVRDQM